MKTFIMAKGDRRNSLYALLKHHNKTAYDLSNCTVSFHMKNADKEVTGTATIISASDGSVRYDWGETDTITAGVFEAEFIVTDQLGKVESFPADGNFTVTIRE